MLTTLAFMFSMHSMGILLVCINEPKVNECSVQWLCIHGSTSPLISEDDGENAAAKPVDLHAVDQWPWLSWREQRPLRKGWEMLGAQVGSWGRGSSIVMGERSWFVKEGNGATGLVGTGRQPFCVGQNVFGYAIERHSPPYPTSEDIFVWLQGL